MKFDEIIKLIPIEPFYQNDNVVLYNADCLNILSFIPNKSIDLCLTDPFYNCVNIGPNKKTYINHKDNYMRENEYIKFCKKWFIKAHKTSRKIIFTPGISNTHFYPKPYWQICWHKPAAVSFNRMGGFNAWEPILCYLDNSKCVKLGQDYILCDTLNFSKGYEKGHPCPKPKDLYIKLINIFSKENDIILDVFAGSGTTGVACIELNRKSILIEKEIEYCKIIKERLILADKERKGEFYIPESELKTGLFANIK
jgi:site-specific DNA-methyltransferase (adenine-specific)